MKQNKLLRVLLILAIVMTMFPSNVSAHEKANVASAQETEENSSNVSTIADTNSVIVNGFTTGELGKEIEKQGISIATITDLTVSNGVLNDADFQYIKEHMPILARLDLSGTTCVNNKIPDDAFYTGMQSQWVPNHNQYLTTFLFPQGIVEIGNRAFIGCVALNNLGYGEGVLQMPDTVTIIGSESFKQTHSFTSLILPPNLLTVRGWSFTESNGLSGEVVIPGSLKTIGQGLFATCPNIESVIISEGVEKIDPFVFRNVTSLKNVKLPSTLKVIDKENFDKCSQLTEITLNEGLETLGFLSFTGTSITYLKLPSTLKSYNSALNYTNAVIDFRDCDESITIEQLDRAVTFIFPESFSGKEIPNVGTGKSSNTDIVSDYQTLSDGTKGIQIGNISGTAKIGNLTIQNMHRRDIIYYANDGSDTQTTQDCYVNFETTVSDNMFVRAGYYFNGWNTESDGNGISYGSNAKLIPSDHVSLYAQWVEKTSSFVSFIADLELNKTFDNQSVSISSSDYNVTVGAGDVSFLYQVKNGNNWNDFDGTPIDAGKYRVKVVVAENDDFKASESVWKEFTIQKANPNYEVPSDLKIAYGQTLADVKLPKGFVWQDADTTVVGSIGTHIFHVMYIPEDANYRVVSDIPVTLTVYLPETIDKDQSNGNQSNMDVPNTGDRTDTLLWMNWLIASAGIVWLSKQKRKWQKS